MRVVLLWDRATEKVVSETGPALCLCWAYVGLELCFGGFADLSLRSAAWNLWGPTPC